MQTKQPAKAIYVSSPPIESTPITIVNDVPIILRIFSEKVLRPPLQVKYDSKILNEGKSVTG